MTYNNLFNAIKTSELQKLPVIKFQYSIKSIIVLSVLLKEGFIRGYFLDVVNNIKFIFVLIKCKRGKFNFSKFKKYYFNTYNIYNNFTFLKQKQSSFNLCIISTRKGIMTDKNAIALGLGGFVLIKVN
jgi:ribosomal protein S8